MTVISARGATLRVVVLRSTVNEVERFCVVHGDFVELGHWQVADKAPRLGVVPAFIEAAVRTEHNVLGIGRMKRNGVVINVLQLVIEASECLAAVVGNL